MTCSHRECTNAAVERIEVPATGVGYEPAKVRVVDVCPTHYHLLDHAQRYEGGYSVINTEDNIYGWRLEPKS